MRFTRPTVAAAVAVLLLLPFALLAVLVVGQTDGLHALDLHITDNVHRWALAHPWWVRFMSWWSLAFDPNVWRVAAAVLTAWLLRRGDRALAWWVVVTMTAGGVLGALIKLLVGRDRPDLLEPVARAAGYSFPSGHALNNALGAAVFVIVLIPHTRRKVTRLLLWAGAIGIPLITGISRVGLGVHWTSDVVGGWLLGVAVAAITATAFLMYGSPRMDEQRIG